MMTLHMARASAASGPMRIGWWESAWVGGGGKGGGGEVVVPVDVGVDRVRVPDEGELGEEPVVHRGGRIVEPPGDVPAGAEVLELGVAVGHGRAEEERELPRREGPGLGREERQDRLRALLLDGVETL